MIHVDVGEGRSKMTRFHVRVNDDQWVVKFVIRMATDLSGRMFEERSSENIGAAIMLVTEDRTASDTTMLLIKKPFMMGIIPIQALSGSWSLGLMFKRVF